MGFCSLIDSLNNFNFVPFLTMTRVGRISTLLKKIIKINTSVVTLRISLCALTPILYRAVHITMTSVAKHTSIRLYCGYKRTRHLLLFVTRHVPSSEQQKLTINKFGKKVDLVCLQAAEKRLNIKQTFNERKFVITMFFWSFIN